MLPKQLFLFEEPKKWTGTTKKNPAPDMCAPRHFEIRSGSTGHGCLSQKIKVLFWSTSSHRPPGKPSRRLSVTRCGPMCQTPSKRRTDGRTSVCPFVRLSLFPLCLSWWNEPRCFIEISGDKIRDKPISTQNLVSLLSGSFIKLLPPDVTF